MTQPFDLHMHSNMSDGTDTPAKVVSAAFDAGLSLCALTDHDTMAGVAAARAEGVRLGIPVVPGLEFDVEFDGLLHILGLGVDVDSPLLLQMESEAKARRDARNAEILKRLCAVGVELTPYMQYSLGMTTRLHIGKAIVRAGAAQTTREAFDKYLRRGCPGNVYVERPSQQKVIDAIHAAGGLAVLAHPCKLACDPHEKVRELVECGLDGLEAYYPTSTEGQTELFLSLAAQYGLLVTCGSDYHGGNRNVAPGAGWQDVPALSELFNLLMNRYTKI